MTLPMTGEECEAIFRAALSAGDAEAVAAALRVMVAIDPRRAAALHDLIQVGLAMAAARDQANERVDQPVLFGWPPRYPTAPQADTP